MMDRMPNDRFDLRELSDTLRETLKGSSNPKENVLETTILSLLHTREPHSCGRIVTVLNQFMFLGEVVFDEHDMDPSSYNEPIFEKDLENWQSVMNIEDDVYMMEPYGFIAKGQEHMICKLHRFIF